jgi:excisionase family DNA binding protein
MQDRFTAVEAARAVNVSEATIRNYIRAGRLVAEKDGTSWSITRESLESTFGTLAELDFDVSEASPAPSSSLARATSQEPVAALLDAITRPMNDMLDVLRAQLDAKDRRIAELETQVSELQQKLSTITSQVSGQSASQTQAWQEFLRIHTAQMASLTTQLSRATAPAPVQKTGFLRRLFSS